ncbi:MAG TPA: hypothetical protein VFR23_00935 [Jiangellaceae bacterium]|nr:hypothetical protein [Jiangellaceae bacterium]
MSLEDWQALGIVAGALVAVLIVLAWTARGMRRMWHLMRKANRWLDQALGEPPRDGQPGRPSLMQRVEAIETRMGSMEAKLTGHLEWHNEPKGKPARGQSTRSSEQYNGPGVDPRR